MREGGEETQKNESEYTAKEQDRTVDNSWASEPSVDDMFANK